VADLRALVRGAARGVGDGAALRASLEALPPVLDKTARLEDGLLQAELQGFVQDTRALLVRARPLVDGLAAGPAADAAKQQRVVDELQTTLRSLDGAARRAERLLGTVEAKQGAAGRLFYDEAFADDVKSVVKAVREDPVKFLLR